MSERQVPLTPMRVAAVVVDPASQSPVLILRGVGDPRRFLPIFIGGLEATAIATFLANVEVPRPLTHDLLASLIGELGWQVDRVTVPRLEDGTFFAVITLADGAGATRDIDARPSDSIALALRAGAPILVADAVLDEAGGFADEEAGADAADASGQTEDETPTAPGDEPSPHGATVDSDVRLEDLDPEQFGKYKM